MTDFTELYCFFDDFVKAISPSFITSHHRGRKQGLALSEIITIITGYHACGFQFSHFKTYYTYLKAHHLNDFPLLPSYNRFVEFIPQAVIPLCIFMLMQRRPFHGVGFVDSCSLKVCHQKRISSHKVFKGLAARGKTSVGWFYGFKLHLIVDPYGEIINFALTAGNVHDKNPIETLCKNIIGKIFGDKGYLGKAFFQKMFKKGIHMITKIKVNMSNILMDYDDKIFLKKRGVIESVFNVLKSSLNLEHTRHRSPINFLSHIFSVLAAYTLRSSKPSIAFPDNVLNKI